jgi:hypothetical protein
VFLRHESNRPERQREAVVYVSDCVVPEGDAGATARGKYARCVVWAFLWSTPLCDPDDAVAKYVQHLCSKNPRHPRAWEWSSKTLQEWRFTGGEELYRVREDGAWSVIEWRAGWLPGKATR